MALSRFITPIGIIMLLHSAYSCLHYRSIISSSTLDLLDGSTTYNASSPPKDVVIECLLGYFLCLMGQIISAGEFLPVMGSGRREVKAPMYITRDFDLWTTRAGIIASVKSKNQ
uniref:Membrane magnesium transporter n=1 Tax=Chaetoceros debilis TaxID=122233 RepID=A0A7S3PVW2_9STRA|mmetsp:Transcript_4886/g.7151  ORF Transcript_4886/g.7151 Transcript_4886/m.7151 type:complete len:114 (+) Transcript_4886:121-462(+)|eukprot:CAMPEP_0194082604 /NCGR_PEP_ID=MMETSP0149-20130528/8063_1 /TAXON_ID=122233 /ORGANISM="Chaetoceros debilis, Strain MM31A-1" /LENGTH=113 /DNA_ID=CAMNT_0038764793 /DNA_START=91 /DNA_END=432 /DNA_ORIENTATION=+